MQVEVSFSRLQDTIESLKIIEKSLRKDLRELQELCIRMKYSEHTAIRKIADRLEVQETVFHRKCDSLGKLQRVLDNIKKQYENTEEEILDASDDIPRFEESASLKDLGNIRQLISQYF